MLALRKDVTNSISSKENRDSSTVRSSLTASSSRSIVAAHGFSVCGNIAHTFSSDKILNGITIAKIGGWTFNKRRPIGAEAGMEISGLRQIKKLKTKSPHDTLSLGKRREMEGPGKLTRKKGDPPESKNILDH